jgi:hypothetical protein
MFTLFKFAYEELRVLSVITMIQTACRLNRDSPTRSLQNAHTLLTVFCDLWQKNSVIIRYIHVLSPKQQSNSIDIPENMSLFLCINVKSNIVECV